MSFLDSFFGSNPKEQNSVKKLPAAEFLVAVLDKTVQLIDVRTQREYDAGHIRGAMNIDWFQPLLFKRSIRDLDKKQPVYIYCRTGNRSEKASRKLTKLGFTQIYDLQGGITAVK